MTEFVTAIVGGLILLVNMGPGMFASTIEGLDRIHRSLLQVVSQWMRKRRHSKGS